MSALPQITYTIAMPQPHTHLYDVSIDVAGLSGNSSDFVLPSWTPGSYLIRDYARHVQEFTAEADGTALIWRKTAKDTWQVETNGAERIQVRYRVYANELTVRTSHLDGSHGYVNGATVFMFIPERTAESLVLHVQTPQGWQVTTGLEPAADQTPVTQAPFSRRTADYNLQTRVFIATDYDELIDCPVECGTHRLLTFEVDGIEHRIAIWGRGNEDEARLVADTRRIVEVERDLFGGLPYRHYTFILHLTAGRGGGLEHRNSVTNLLNRWTFRPERAYERFLGLQSHEFFHVWNVKRIRAEPLGPFDYRRENYTRQLWAMEGVTSYYDNLFLVRAGLITPERYLEILADEILNLQSQPGRALQSLEQSSFDAWIKYYRPDENSGNSGVSYYLKGGLVSLLLDMEIRRRTDNARSLDDVLRYLYTTYPITGPGIPEAEGYVAAIETVAGSDDGFYRDFFARYIASTVELDYDQGLSYAGLRLEWGYRNRRDSEPPAWLGLRLKTEEGRTVVASLRSDSPAYSAGIYAGDELLALDGWRINDALLPERLAEHAPGQTVTLTLFRRDELLQIPVTLATAPYDKLSLVRSDQPDALQERIYQSWLGRQS
jgi:predicted metalloprotease with PDZ domain